MNRTTIHGRMNYLEEVDFNPDQPCRPNPIVTFAPFSTHGHLWKPNFGDTHSLILLKRNLPKKVSFQRAYTGWRMSGSREEAELGEGRAFLRWLQKHHLSIAWSEKDFKPHPYFSQNNSPTHAQNDDLARGHSFAIKPIMVNQRSIKLYVRDEDMLSLLKMPYGDEEDFLELVMRYVSKRFEWEKWRAPAPGFLDWIVSHGKRPLFFQGQLGFRPHTAN